MNRPGKVKFKYSGGNRTCFNFYPVQVFDTSDLPGGVVNILSGSRDHVTKYLTEHQHVDAMWYFGSAEVRNTVTDKLGCFKTVLLLKTDLAFVH